MTVCSSNKIPYVVGNYQKLQSTNGCMSIANIWTAAGIDLGVSVASCVSVERLPYATKVVK